jgi:hypothetical protein
VLLPHDIDGAADVLLDKATLSWSELGSVIERARQQRTRAPSG